MFTFCLRKHWCVLVALFGVQGGGGYPSHQVEQPS